MDGTSVLANLTAQVMADKKAEARKLTPVAGEVGSPGALPTTPASFPNDMPQEVVAQKVAELTRIIDHLSEARDALAALADVRVAGEVPDPLAEQKAAERAADERAAAKANDNEPIPFAEKFEAQKKAAQAAVFEQPIQNGIPGATVGDPDEWRCPVHDKPGITKTSQKSGRQFIGCPDCNSFKR